MPVQVHPEYAMKLRTAGAVAGVRALKFRSLIPSPDLWCMCRSLIFLS